jgi:hypothetical protein
MNFPVFPVSRHRGSLSRVHNLFLTLYRLITTLVSNNVFMESGGYKQGSRTVEYAFSILFPLSDL